MPSSELIDHSPHQPIPRDPIPTASNVILIDNYDSFTWNVYQYLALEGATVTVYRNDELSLEDIIKKNPTHLVISPGPGHPSADAGLSNAAIRHFAGKIPILGVCLGEQCMFEVFGGTVDVTGEILHGKTSNITHDGKGCYENLPQNIPVTRYHSLAGTHSTLPDTLEITSWTHSSDGKDKIIMGVRHKEYTIEGVQFHPESILTAGGRPMLYNFLKLTSGTWTQNQQAVVDGAPISTSSKESILEKIYRHREIDVEAQKKIPSLSPESLVIAYNLNLAPPQISFIDRLKSSPFPLSLMAEIKRASPSKGIISITANAPEQAVTYAKAGASVISVLTEPEWFKGSIDDLKFVRQALDGMLNRPAILRKEFIFDDYQILEARLAGADTVLLIVKMLEPSKLRRLYNYSLSLNMEPLVEVNTLEEMAIAIELGAKVIGVNNRNLTNFEVDMETTTSLMSTVPKETIVCALSGISGPKDVEPYLKNGVGAVLVGEALMRATNVTQFIAELLGSTQVIAQQPPKKKAIVKICGTRSSQAALTAIEAGADLIGMILVPGRKRKVSNEVALEISQVVHQTKKPKVDSTQAAIPPTQAIDWFDASAQYLSNPNRALLVGVFQDQSLEHILQQQQLLDLDVVQLHGSEPLEWAKLIPVPVIKSFGPADLSFGTRGYHVGALVDSGTGGSGTRLDLTELKDTLENDTDVKIILAGGLNPDNLQDVFKELESYHSQVIGVDVSSGVEKDGEQDLDIIKQFVSTAKDL